MKLLAKITDKDIIGTEGLSTRQPPREAVRIILLDDNNSAAVLYVKKYNFYTLPGGGIDADENFIQAVVRESLEETGCDCEIVCELGEVHENSLKYNHTEISYGFLCKLKGEKGIPNYTPEEVDEGTTVQWHKLDKALELISNQHFEPDSYEKYGMRLIMERDIILVNERLKAIKNRLVK